MTESFYRQNKIHSLLSVVLGIGVSGLGAACTVSEMQSVDRSVTKGSRMSGEVASGYMAGVVSSPSPSPSPSPSETSSPGPTVESSSLPASSAATFSTAVRSEVIDCGFYMPWTDVKIRRIAAVREGTSITQVGIYCLENDDGVSISGLSKRSGIRFVTTVPDDFPGSGGSTTGSGRGTGSLPSMDSADGGIDRGGSFGTDFGGEDEDEEFTPPDLPGGGFGGGPTTGGGGGGATTGSSSGGSSSGTSGTSGGDDPLTHSDFTWSAGGTPSDETAVETETKDPDGINPVYFFVSAEGPITHFGSDCSDSIYCYQNSVPYQSTCGESDPIRGIRVYFDASGNVVGVVARRKSMGILGSDCTVEPVPTEARSGPRLEQASPFEKGKA